MTIVSDTMSEVGIGFLTKPLVSCPDMTDMYTELGITRFVMFTLRSLENFDVVNVTHPMIHLELRHAMSTQLIAPIHLNLPVLSLVALEPLIFRRTWSIMPTHLTLVSALLVALSARSAFKVRMG